MVSPSRPDIVNNHPQPLLTATPVLPSSSVTPRLARPTIDISLPSYRRAVEAVRDSKARRRAVAKLVEPEHDAFQLRGDSVISRRGSTSLEKESSKRRISATGEEDEESGRVEKRQDAEGYPSCLNQPNYVLSCFPDSNTTLIQGTWSKFVFNSRFPTFIGAGKVDIYLFHSDSETLATSYLGIDTARGTIGIQPEDPWWPFQTSWNQGTNVTHPYFFVIVDANATLTGGEQHQATFRAIQTAAPSSLSASILSVSLASASSQSSLSAASLSSAAFASSSAFAALHSTTSPTSSTGTSTSTSPPDSSLQNGNRSSTAIPNWAIALLVIFGVFALLVGLALAYFCLGAVRRKRAQRERNGVGENGRERGVDSLGSAEPILGAEGGSNEGGGGGGARGSGSSTDHNNLIDTSSALLMAEAFRNQLRRPTFFPKEEPSHSGSGSEGGPILGANMGSGGVGNDSPGRDNELLERELMNEGMSTKSVGKKWGSVEGGSTGG